jgi:hypothetical protein
MPAGSRAGQQRRPLDESQPLATIRIPDSASSKTATASNCLLTEEI